MTPDHYCMSPRAYSLSLGEFPSLFSTFVLLHRAERRDSHLELLVTASLLETPYQVPWQEKFIVLTFPHAESLALVNIRIERNTKEC